MRGMNPALGWLRENAWGHIDFHPTPQARCLYALVILFFFFLLGAVFRWRIEDREMARAVGWALWGVGAVWAGLTVVPGPGRIAYVAFACLTGLIGMAMNFVLLSALYVSVFAVARIILRLCGMDLLNRRRFHAGASSAWIEHRPPPGPERYRRLS